MNKMIAAAVASVFAFAATSTLAADAARKDELTIEQRAEMRERAAQMKTHREQAPVQDKVEKKAQKAKTSAVDHSRKVKGTAKRDARKVRPQA